VRVYGLPRLLEMIVETQARWREYYFWDSSRDLLPKQAVLESIIVADTLNGDEVIFHPSNPDALYLLPRHTERICWIGARFEDALEWLCTSGVVSQPVGSLSFELAGRARGSRAGDRLPRVATGASNDHGLSHAAMMATIADESCPQRRPGRLAAARSADTAVMRWPQGSCRPRPWGGGRCAGGRLAVGRGTGRPGHGRSWR